MLVCCMYTYTRVKNCLSTNSAYVYVCIFLYVHVSYSICMYLNVFDRMFAVSLGCFHDDVRAEPGSWMVVGMIPVFDKKKATRGKGPTEDGPNGPATRRAEDGPNGAAFPHPPVSERPSGGLERSD